MKRYRFTRMLGGHDFLEEYSSVLDDAIRTATMLSSPVGIIYVMDTDSSPAVARGVAEDGKWAWMVKCKACRGSGEIVNRAVQMPGGQQRCNRCDGIGVVRDR